MSVAYINPFAGDTGVAYAPPAIGWPVYPPAYGVHLNNHPD
jgi:hypothetical protein